MIFLYLLTYIFFLCVCWYLSIYVVLSTYQRPIIISLCFSQAQNVYLRSCPWSGLAKFLFAYFNDRKDLCEIIWRDTS